MAKDSDALLWEQWGEEYVVYQPGSGNTHFLNAAGALLLHSLARADSDAATLAAEIGRRTEAPVDDALVARIEESLVHFEHLGLVSRLPSGPCTP